MIQPKVSTAFPNQTEFIDSEKHCEEVKINNSHDWKADKTMQGTWMQAVLLKKVGLHARWN